MRWDFGRTAFVALSIAGLPGTAVADVIADDAFNFREIRSGQALNVATGDRLIFGADFIDSDTGTRPANAIVTARNTNTNQVFALNPFGTTGYSANIGYTPDFANGDWQVTVESDQGTDFFVLPAFGTGPGTGQIPGVENLSVNGSGANRTLNWDLPANLPTANDGNVDRLRIRVEDSNFNRAVDERLATGTSLSTTSFDLPDTAITHNGVFSMQVFVEGFAPFNRSRTDQLVRVEDVGVGGTAVEIDPDAPFSFRDVRGPNSVNFGSGDLFGLGIELDPAFTENTFVDAEQNGHIALLGRAGDRPNEFSTSIPYDPSLTGSWTISAYNGEFETNILTRAVGDVAALDFVNNISLSPDGVTPTINWALPANTANIDDISIGLFDDVTNARIPIGPNGSLFQTIDSDSTSFTFPDGILEEGKAYVARIILRDRDQDDSTISRSLQFVNFTPIIGDPGPPIFLPTVDEQGRFIFNIDVAANVPILIDPFIAIGYDYEIGEGDPNFRSIMVPEVEGDDSFILSFFDGVNDIEIPLLADVEFLFPEGGVSAFTILGIDPAAMLDPGDVTAFISQVSFVADGRFTGTMTPITLFVPDPVASVSEPATATLFLAGTSLIFAIVRRRRGYFAGKQETTAPG